MGTRYLIDSNVIIDYSAGRLPPEGCSFIEYLFNNDFLTSVVVKIEVLGFNDIADNILFLDEFLKTATLIPLDDSITKETIMLRRKNRKLKLGDAIIAATANVHNLTLITRNVKDFRDINGLAVLNLWDLE